MKVLLVAATPFELAPAIQWLEKEFTVSEVGLFKKGTLEVSILITGVGILATGWRLGAYFAKNTPDFAINAGIAGALDLNLKLGDVVQITEEVLGDLGVEESDGRFLDLFTLGFVNPDEFPYFKGKMHNPGAENLHYLPSQKGITVHKAHGFAPSIAAFKEKYPEAQVESMEGAAFFHACLHAGVPFAEIRAISNYVESRNRDAWEIPGAINALNEVLIKMLGALASL